MGSRKVSRRSMLAGLGAATGAAVTGGVGLSAVGMGPAAAASGDGGSGTGLPTVHAAGQANPGVILQALPAINPAFNYRTIPYNLFIPRVVTGLNLAVSLTTGLGATAGSTTLFAPLDLPQGAVIREAAFECYNANSSTGLGVGINTITLASPFVGGFTAFTSTSAGKHTVVITPNPPITVDNTTTGYSLSAFLEPLSTDFGLFGARVAWTNGLRLSMLPAGVRKLDTRAAGPLTGKINVGQTKVLSLGPQLISGAKAALLNLTLAETEGFSGFVSLFPAGTTWPGTSSANWSQPGQNIANSQTVAVSGAGAVNILGGGSPGSRAHVIVDLLGYYT